MKIRPDQLTPARLRWDAWVDHMAVKHLRQAVGAAIVTDPDMGQVLKSVAAYDRMVGFVRRRMANFQRQHHIFDSRKVVRYLAQLACESAHEVGFATPQSKAVCERPLTLPLWQARNDLALYPPSDQTRVLKLCPSYNDTPTTLGEPNDLPD